MKTLEDTNAYKSLFNIAKALQNDYGFVPYEAIFKSAKELCELEGLFKHQRAAMCLDVVQTYNCQIKIK